MPGRRLAHGLCLLVLLPALAGGCTRVRDADAGRYAIGREAALVLPAPPGYPGTARLSQLVIGEYEGRRQAIQADVSLAPDEVRLVLSLPAGPRAMDIRWTGKGVRVERSDLVPAALDGPRILVDLFVARWPLAAVAAALEPGVEVRETPAGRTILFGGEPVAEYLRQETAQGETTLIRNFDLGYSLRIRTRQADG